MPPGAIWGRDFRDGLYDPARAFSVEGSGWPPMTLIVAWPFTLVQRSTAYAVEVGLMAGAAVGSAVLSAVLALRAVAPAHRARRRSADGAVDAQSLGIVLGVWLLTSYGFMYELQRGNVNLFALFFSLLAVWLTLRLPRSPWWPAVVLAVAINLKLYPAILLALLFWRYRLRAVVPVLVTNAVLLLIAGPVNAAAARGVADDGRARDPRRRPTATWARRAPRPSCAPRRLGSVVGGGAALRGPAGAVGGDGDRPDAARVEQPAGGAARGGERAAHGGRADAEQRLQARAVRVPARRARGGPRRVRRSSGAGSAGVSGSACSAGCCVFMARSSAFHGWGLVGSKYSLAVLVQAVLLRGGVAPRRPRGRERVARPYVRRRSRADRRR